MFFCDLYLFICLLLLFKWHFPLHSFLAQSESIRITQQPEATPGVEGEQLVLECVATGVPAPSFLWFKDPRVPLPDQTSSNLVIPRLSKQDAGRYCCRAQNEVNVVFSAWVEVKVQKPGILLSGKSLVVEVVLLCCCVVVCCVVVLLVLLCCCCDVLWYVVFLCSGCVVLLCYGVVMLCCCDAVCCVVVVLQYNYVNFSFSFFSECTWF